MKNSFQIYLEKSFVGRCFHAINVMTTAVVVGAGLTCDTWSRPHVCPALSGGRGILNDVLVPSDSEIPDPHVQVTAAKSAKIGSKPLGDNRRSRNFCPWGCGCKTASLL